MENTAKVHRRLSLTLSNRLHQKRHSASPQSRVRSSDASDAPISPKVQLVRSTESVECTPPHKKYQSLDDSVDFSPRLDISLSPSCLYSQTLVTESPEVGWRWNRSNNNDRRFFEKTNATTDSGFDSAESIAVTAGTTKECGQQARNDKGRLARRNQLDNEKWRAQQTRSRELLKERCNKLHRQLEQVAVASKPTSLTEILDGTVGVSTRSATQARLATPPPLSNDAALADFLNDSDTDCLLLEATQQLETDTVPTQPEMKASTPTTSHRQPRQKENERSSFYMKFLEDENETDAWLAALDEAMLQASCAKKQRISLQRYNSMPTTTGGESTDCTASLTNVIAGSSNRPSTSTTNTSSNSSACRGSNLVDPPRMKRHASSHILSPATSHARGKLFGSRK